MTDERVRTAADQFVIRIQGDRYAPVRPEMTATPDRKSQAGDDDRNAGPLLQIEMCVRQSPGAGKPIRQRNQCTADDKRNRLNGTRKTILAFDGFLRPGGR